MCGRYYIKEDCWDKAAEDFSILKDRTDGTLPCGDISPGMPAVSITAGRQTEAAVQTLLWGFAGFARGKRIINARSEGVRQKPLFADSFRERRCVLPCSGFYEWDARKEKVTFTLSGENVLYLAGIFRPYGEEKHFVILTREANASMQPVHDRMPLLIRKEDVVSWLTDYQAAEEILMKPLPELQAKRDYEHYSLFENGVL